MPPKRQHTQDDDESREGSSVAGDHLEEEMDGKDKKSSASSSQIRKAQNRIAQREFRLRKQQYIRDLEARVEVLSGDKEERVELMLLSIRNSLKENKESRGMLKNMASFVGEGLGSCLPRLGLSNEQLESISNRADSDTAYEAFVSFKASKELGEANPGIPLGQVRKRGDSTAEPGSSAGAGSLIGTPLSAAAQAKRKRESEGGDSDKRVRGATPASTPGSSGAGASNPVNHGEMWNFSFTTEATAVGGPGPSAFPGSYTGPPGATTQQATMPAPPPQAPGQMTGVAGSSPESERNNLRSAVAQLTSSDKAPLDRQGSVIVTEPNNMTRGQVEERRRMQEELRQSMEGEEAAERKTEASQSITYHSNNFRINHEYMLPPSLRPTPVQQTIPHEHAIDGILFPSVRDRMISLRGRYDSLEAFHGYVTEFTLHGDDALDHRNWEASEKWSTQFKISVDDEVYAITNRWRATRGSPPLKRDTRDAEVNAASAAGAGSGSGAGLAAELMQSAQPQPQA